MNKNGERCFYSFIYIFICSPHALTNHVFGCMQLQSCSSFCSHVNKTVNTLIPTAMAAKSQISCKKRMDVGTSEREALNLHSFYRPAGGSWSGWKKSDCIEVQSLISGLTECNKTNNLLYISTQYIRVCKQATVTRMHTTSSLFLQCNVKVWPADGAMVLNSLECYCGGEGLDF